MATPRSLPAWNTIRTALLALTTAFALVAVAAVAAPAAHAAPATVAAGPELRQGSTGPGVASVQERLTELGYWIDGVDGRFGPLTEQAVVALQKAAGIARDGVVGPDTRSALAEGVRPKARTSSGDLLEIDLERQLLLVVSDGEVERVISTSTGSGRPYEASDGTERIATTPTGTYTVFRGVDAWDPGPYGALYRPKYFNGGIAVHGYPVVPPQPASHGCARVSMAAMDWLWESGNIDVHTTVLVR
ncbi:MULTISPECIES: L,D-transpeptidase family protein [Nocardiopsis]|uniref:Peptidoglycan hydrolase-like protein with peptidoglycan-binding domain n=1 Tax=Nocardiopsis sinuspersici TaxID=501010 RepID=A0A1V3C6W9_9ACTN|nr:MULTISPECIES: L,D-transpeptidase family protein [Nocardiopsis]NYH52846.1 peptidoglycan hydrolase-like protein with peptidoglycan-binding domain [Nocardiopsis sinuspersici]OOC56239.1 peptidoglycan-binding protein [Nocardiopsis sinuspersici]